MYFLQIFIVKLLTCLAIYCSGFAIANDHAHHNHAAHIHGYAELTLAIDENTLSINMSIPAHTLIGFEHQATTPEDLAKVDALIKTLSKVENIIFFPNKHCKVSKEQLTLGRLLPMNNNEKYSTNDNHTEVAIDLIFSCDNLSSLSSVVINIFDYYPAIEEIKSYWITNTHQGTAKLTSAQNVLSFK